MPVPVASASVCEWPGSIDASLCIPAEVCVPPPSVLALVPCRNWFWPCVVVTGADTTGLLLEAALLVSPAEPDFGVVRSLEKIRFSHCRSEVRELLAALVRAEGAGLVEVTVGACWYVAGRVAVLVAVRVWVVVYDPVVAGA